MTFDITASIVLFHNDRSMLARAIASFLNTRLNVKLYLIDNSGDDALKNMSSDIRCEYIFNGANLGFGKAHNLALTRSSAESPYHLVLNPDVYFDPGTLESIFAYMQQNQEVGQLMPKVLYPDGELQYSGKLLPAPIDLVARRVFKDWSYFKKRNERYELRKSGYDKIMNVPQHLGCFLFVRTGVLPKSGLFDEDMFMYMEDIDLTRRVHEWCPTLYYPLVSIYHHYGKGSKKNPKLLGYHVRSAIRYFNKWGWLFDAGRRRINKRALESYT